MFGTMTTTKLDLAGLKCPLPALKTRKALKTLPPGDRLEVHCTDPLSVIDIPNLIRETGDKVEITERSQSRIVFLIEKTNVFDRKNTIRLSLRSAISTLSPVSRIRLGMSITESGSVQ